jgi:acyl carrier protein
MSDVSTEEAVQMLAEVAGTSGIDPETEFGSLGIDSLQAVEWLTMLEERFGVEFNLRDFDMSVFTDHSVSDVLDLLRKQVAELRRNEEATAAE